MCSLPPSPSSCCVLGYDCWIDYSSAGSAGSGFDQEVVSEEESFILRDPNCIEGPEPSGATGY